MAPGGQGRAAGGQTVVDIALRPPNAPQSQPGAFPGHSRQAVLPLEPEVQLLPRLNPTAPKERKGALQRKCLAILGRLQAGPACNTELLGVGGLRYSARIAELRAAGHVIHTDENKATGLVFYTLELP